MQQSQIWQWVDTIVVTGCGAGCKTEGGCRSWNCTGVGRAGLYRWDRQVINCNS